MPIIGLTDEKSFDLNRAMPRIGKLRKGSEKERNRPGQDLDHFRVTFEEEFAHFEADFKELYGDEPKEFPEIQFFAPDVDSAFETWYESYDSKQTLLTRCDGENIHLKYMPISGTWQKWVEGETAKIDCLPKADHEEGGCGVCQRIGRLRVVLIDFAYKTGAYGYFEIETHSINDIISLYSGLRLMHQRFRTLLGIPFVLGRSPRPISTPMGTGANGEVKRGKTTKHLLYIRPAETFVKDVMLALPQPQLHVLPPPSIDPEEGRKLLATGGERRIGSSNGNGAKPEPETVEGEIVEDEPGQVEYSHWSEDPAKIEFGKLWKEGMVAVHGESAVKEAQDKVSKSDHDTIISYTGAIEAILKAPPELESDTPDEPEPEEEKPKNGSVFGAATQKIIDKRIEEIWDQMESEFEDREQFDRYIKNSAGSVFQWADTLKATIRQINADWSKMKKTA